MGRQTLQCVQGLKKGVKKRRRGNGGTGTRVSHSEDFPKSKDKKKAEESVPLICLQKSATISIKRDSETGGGPKYRKAAGGFRAAHCYRDATESVQHGQKVPIRPHEEHPIMRGALSLLLSQSCNREKADLPKLKMK